MFSSEEFIYFDIIIFLISSNWILYIIDLHGYKAYIADPIHGERKTYAISAVLNG